MKRDLDLARQLLLDVENHGPDCTLSVLRSGVPANSASESTRERIRYHLRLLIDAGLAKELEHNSAGLPCLRLTHAGHELLDLARSDERWQAAKRSVHEATGGLSLTAIRAILTKWAVEGASRGERRYTNVAPSRGYRPYYHRVEPRRRHDPYRYESSRLDREPIYRDAPVYREAPLYRDNLRESEELRLVRTRPDYRERLEPIVRDYAYSSAYSAAYPADRFEYDTEAIDGATGVTVPVYLV